MLLLDNDIQQCMRECRDNIRGFDELSEARQIVLVDMCFNLGMAGLMKFRKMLRAVELGTFHLAADEMMASKWASQVGRRAESLAGMMREG
jgi:lysozyme